MTKTKEYKHTVEELRMKQDMPLSMKEIYFREAVREFMKEFDDDVYVSISGGKDSEVLLYLVRKYFGNVEAVYASTGLDYPSVKEMALAHENVTVVKPIKSHFEILTEFGYPVISKDVSLYIYGARHGRTEETRQHYRNRFDGLDDNGNYSERRQAYKKYKFLLDAPFEISDKCCYFLKEKPCRDFEFSTSKKPISGLLASESYRRLQSWLKTGCNSFSNEDGTPMCKPLSIWKEEDILQFLHENEEEMLKSLKKECLNKGMTEEEFKEAHKHPWAADYGEIIPVLSKNQTDGQLNMFETLGLDYDGCGFKTTGCDRTGCMYCMFGAQCKGDMRFVRLKENYPDIYSFVMRGGAFDEDGMWKPGRNPKTGEYGLGFKFIIDWMNEHGNLNIRY